MGKAIAVRGMCFQYCAPRGLCTGVVFLLFKGKRHLALIVRGRERLASAPGSGHRQQERKDNLQFCKLLQARLHWVSLHWHFRLAATPHATREKRSAEKRKGAAESHPAAPRLRKVTG